MTTAPAPVPADLSAAVAEVAAQSEAWLSTSAAERADLMDAVIRATSATAQAWVDAANAAKGITPGTPAAGEEWLSGPGLLMRNARLLRDALRDLAAGRAPRVAGGLGTRPDGRVVAKVFPASKLEATVFAGTTGEIWLEPGVTEQQARAEQAARYLGAGPRDGGVCLVLGAGNVSSPRPARRAATRRCGAPSPSPSSCTPTSWPTRAWQRPSTGTVGVNAFHAMGFVATSLTWGAFPGHELHDIQSGRGVVGNTAMLPRPEKSVVRGPWRTSPKPPTFPSSKAGLAVSRRMAAMEADPRWWKVPGLVLAALRG